MNDNDIRDAAQIIARATRGVTAHVNRRDLADAGWLRRPGQEG